MKTWTTIDKSDWERGEWDNEPDKAQWIDEKTGLQCFIKRHIECGHLCGYVAVPKQHALFGKDYTVVDNMLDVPIHGGLTFSERGLILGIFKANWWFGFDCHHGFDYGPAIANRLKALGANYFDRKYRNFDYVVDEVRKLASQLATVKVKA